MQLMKYNEKISRCLTQHVKKEHSIFLKQNMCHVFTQHYYSNYDIIEQYLTKHIQYTTIENLINCCTKHEHTI